MIKIYYRNNFYEIYNEYNIMIGLAKDKVDAKIIALQYLINDPKYKYEDFIKGNKELEQKVNKILKEHVIEWR